MRIDDILEGLDVGRLPDVDDHGGVYFVDGFLARRLDRLGPADDIARYIASAHHAVHLTEHLGFPSVRLHGLRYKRDGDGAQLYALTDVVDGYPDGAWQWVAPREEIERLYHGIAAYHERMTARDGLFLVDVKPDQFVWDERRFVFVDIEPVLADWRMPKETAAAAGFFLHATASHLLDTEEEMGFSFDREPLIQAYALVAKKGGLDPLEERAAAYSEGLRTFL